jgi:hypothetical protein
MEFLKDTHHGGVFVLLWAMWWFAFFAFNMILWIIRRVLWPVVLWIMRPVHPKVYEIMKEGW